MMSKTKKMMIVSMMIALAIIFHMIEALIPLPIMVPGVRLGLANIIGLCALYFFDAKIMLEVNICRVIFASLLRGTIFGSSFFLSICGVLLSSMACIIAKKYTPFSIYGISMIGSMFHNIGQIIAVSILYEQLFMITFFPILNITAIFTGLLIGFVADGVLKRIKLMGGK